MRFCAAHNNISPSANAAMPARLTKTLQRPNRIIVVRRRVKMTRLRARVAERLKGAQNTYAMLTTFNEIDMTNLMKLRADYKVGPAFCAMCEESV